MPSNKSVRLPIPEFDTSVAALVGAMLQLHPNAREVAEDIYNPERYHHEFSNGMYRRTIFLKQGEIIVGKVHRYPCVATCTSGVILIVNNRGGRRTFKAGDQFITEPFHYQVGFALTDCTFTNVHRTDATTVEAAEQELVIPSTELMWKELKALELKE